MKKPLGFCLPLAFIAAAASILLGCSGAQSKNKPSAPAVQSVPVGVATAEQRDMPVYLSGLGTVTAFNTVSIKSRVDGQIVQIAFKEGQEVKQGDLLLVIDPRPFEVQLSQTQAALYRDQSQLRDIKIDLDRFEELYKTGVIAKQQLDSQRALEGQLEGSVRADQAQIDSAKLQLTYSRITAPVSGRIGLRLVDIGNMVHATDQNALLVITQVQPISVIFTLPEDNLPTVAQHMKKGSLPAEAYNRDDQAKLATGILLTIDNQIDQTTGTGRLKATFDNKDNVLWPNQFVNVRLLLETRKNATVVPAATIQRGPQGTFAYVVKKDKTVEVRQVKLAFTDSNLAVLEDGISAGEVVVTDGQDKLQSGSHVEPRSGNGPAASSSVRGYQAPGAAGQ